ncbi:MAG: hypothetical protein RBR67_07130 [Desulfobacterium sp.]|nr:hypothetical protein [Desulfobacterium sp.]
MGNPSSIIHGKLQMHLSIRFGVSFLRVLISTPDPLAGNIVEQCSICSRRR